MYCLACITASEAEAERLARLIVERRLAACAHVLPVGRSFFTWNGSVQSDHEATVICKTRDACRESLVAFVRSEHSYDVPELIFVPIDGGLPEYLSWIGEETTGQVPPQEQ